MSGGGGYVLEPGEMGNDKLNNRYWDYSYFLSYWELLSWVKYVVLEYHKLEI